MDLIFLGDLLNRLPPLQRLKSDLRLELRAVSFPFCFHLVSLSFFLTHEKSYLTPGPIFGGHLKPSGSGWWRWKGKRRIRFTP